jgi:hypothetical protein
MRLRDRKRPRQPERAREAGLSRTDEREQLKDVEQRAFGPRVQPLSGEQRMAEKDVTFGDECTGLSDRERASSTVWHAKRGAIAGDGQSRKFEMRKAQTDASWELKFALVFSGRERRI